MTNGRDQDDADAPTDPVGDEPAGKDRDHSLFTNAPHPGPIPEVLRSRPRPPAPPQGPDSNIAGMARAWAIALDFVFSILAGAGLGWLFDRWRSTTPVGLLVGLGLGFVVAFWRIIRATQKQERDDAARRGPSAKS